MENSRNKKIYKMRRLRKKMMVRMLRFVRNHRIEKYTISLLCCIITLAILKIGLLDRAELTLLDYRFGLKDEQSVSDRIVLIDIAQDSIDQIGRWPWDRSWHAALITALKAFKAKAVLYDVIFSEPSTQKQDRLLKDAIGAAGNIYLPYLFNIEGITSQSLITEDSIYGIETPIEGLEGVVKGEGFINISPDIDGTLRRVPLIIEYKKKLYFQIAFKLACDILGVEKNDIIIKKGRYIRLRRSGPALRSPQVARVFQGRRWIDIPIDENYQMLINWPGGWKDAFSHFSFIDIIKSLRALTKGERPTIPVESLSNKISVVGMSVSGLIDAKPTPIEPLYPAVGVHACILDNILRGDFCKKLPSESVIVLIIILAVVTSRLVSIHHPLRDFLLTTCLMFCYVGAAVLLFLSSGIWINIVYPVTTILLTYIGLTVYNEVCITIERRRLFEMATTDSLTGLCQKGHFNALMKTTFADRRGDKKSGKLSLIMADIDHFKQINDTYGHLFGDIVLKRIAKTIKSICRPLDVCGRYGGEEFIIMLPNTTSKEAISIAERIRKAVEKKIFRYKRKRCRITISLGVTSLKKEKKQEPLIQRADSALYTAKIRGRNKVCKG